MCLCVFQDISSVYQICTDEVLGSGQFGVVYGGQLILIMLLCAENWTRGVQENPVFYDCDCLYAVIWKYTVQKKQFQKTPKKSETSEAEMLLKTNFFIKCLSVFAKLQMLLCFIITSLFFFFFRNSQEVGSNSCHQGHRQDAFPHQTGDAAEKRSGHLTGFNAVFIHFTRNNTKNVTSYWKHVRNKPGTTWWLTFKKMICDIIVRKFTFFSNFLPIYLEWIKY